MELDYDEGKELKYKVIGMARELVANGEITSDKGDELEQLAMDGEINEALNEIEEVIDARDQEKGLQFDDEEKDLFAEAFQEAINDLEDSIEEFRDELQALENGVSRGDMRQYLYGGKSGRTYSEVDDLLDAIDSVSAGGISDRKMAKILSTYTSELNISEVEELIAEMREK